MDSEDDDFMDFVSSGDWTPLDVEKIREDLFIILERRYKVLTEEDICKLLQRVSNTLSIPSVSAAKLLRLYNWEVDYALDAWFSDKEKVRKDVGLLEKFIPSMFTALVSLEDKEEKYCQYLRFYVGDRKTAKWCPGPGCELAIEFLTGSSNYDVVCSCGHSFCWYCLDDAHRPVDCYTVHKWEAISKSCPKCRHPIQKDEGSCLHMTCCTCKFEFCWLCLDDWSTHGQSTGGYFACNVYEKANAEEGLHDEEEKVERMDRCTFFYERFAENQKSRQKAVESLRKLEAMLLPNRNFEYRYDITNAWLQIVECRRVLKWTNVYGYYLPASEKGKTQLFQYLQGQAESLLERLHQLAEVEIQAFDDGPKQGFKSSQRKLVELTSTTRTYFENLVCAVENGLSEVQS